MARFEFDPGRTALIVVDLQNCFVENSPFAAPEGPAVLERLRALARACRGAGVQVIYTAHVVRPDGSNIGVIGQTIPPVKAGVIDDGSPSADLHAGLEVQPDDIVLKKPLFGAFHGTDLDLMLRARRIDTVIIGGISTNVCAETTAREAMAHDYQVIFLADGTATIDFPGTSLGPVTAEEVQRVTCATLGFGFAEVTSCADVTNRLTPVPGQ